MADWNEYADAELRKRRAARRAEIEKHRAAVGAKPLTPKAKSLAHPGQNAGTTAAAQVKSGFEKVSSALKTPPGRLAGQDAAATRARMASGPKARPGNLTDRAKVAAAAAPAKRAAKPSAISSSSPPKPRPKTASETKPTGLVARLGKALAGNKSNQEKALERMKKASRKG